MQVREPQSKIHSKSSQCNPSFNKTIFLPDFFILRYTAFVKVLFVPFSYLTRTTPFVFSILDTSITKEDKSETLYFSLLYMPIPLLVALVAIAVPITLIIVTLLLYARSKKKHGKEWFWKKSAPRLVIFVIFPCVTWIIGFIYLLLIFGVAIN